MKTINLFSKNINFILKSLSIITLCSFSTSSFANVERDISFTKYVEDLKKERYFQPY